jgi:membrane protein implicated in regulation of membrane protease activity
MPDKSKFEREIDKILEKTEKEPLLWTSKREDSHTPRRRSFEAFTPSVPKRKPPARGSSVKINAGHLLVVGLILLAVGAFVPVAQVGFVAAGIVLTLAGYALWFRKGSSGAGGSGFSGGRMFGRGKISSSTPDIEPEVKYWRGRRIEEKPEPRGDRGNIIDFGTAKDDDDSDKR